MQAPIITEGHDLGQFHFPLLSVAVGDVLGREGGARRGRVARPPMLRAAPGRLRGVRLRVKRVVGEILLTINEDRSDFS